jgi:hypothetical protein
VALANGLHSGTTSSGVALGGYRVFIYIGMAVLVALLIVNEGIVPVLDVALAVAALSSVASLIVELIPSLSHTANHWAGDPEALLRGRRVGPQGSLARVRLPGLALVYVMFLPGLAVAVAGPQRLRRTRIAALALMLGAILISLNRNMWIGLAVAMLVASLLTRTSYRRPLFRVALGLLVASAICVTLLATAGGVRGIPERAGSLFDPSRVEGSSSIQDRFRESRHAVTSIRRHPLLGIGPAGDYGAKVYNRKTKTYRTRRFVHNQYLGLAVFYGVPALLLFVAMLLAVAAMGFRVVRRTDDQLLQVVLATTLGTVVAVMLTALVSTAFLFTPSTVSLFFLLGLVMGRSSTAEAEVGEAESSGTVPEAVVA